MHSKERMYLIGSAFILEMKQQFLRPKGPVPLESVSAPQAQVKLTNQKYYEALVDKIHENALAGKYGPLLAANKKSP